jgi:mRNA-degrading endonuclease HigB of HigAB toxin-antitoxin module
VFKLGDKLIEGVAQSLIEIRPVPRGRDRLQASQAGFERTRFVVAAALVAVLVGQVNLDPRELRGEAAERGLDVPLDISHELITTSDVIIRRHTHKHNGPPELTSVAPRPTSCKRVFRLTSRRDLRRRVTAIHYNRRKIYIPADLTHAEYDEGKWRA